MDDGILPRSITAVLAAAITPGAFTGRLILIILLILLAGFFAGSETALTACNRIRLRQLAEDGGRAAKKACAVIDNYDRAIVVILIATNICHTLAASVGALLFIDLLGDAGSVISTVLVTLLAFIFADTVPKNIAMARSDSFVIYSAYPLSFFMRLFYPVAALFTLLSDGFKKRHADKKEPAFTDDELTEIVETVEEEGGLEHEESSIIRSAIEFGDLKVSDIYRPLDKVVSLSVRLPEKEIKDALISVKYSRVPLYRDNPNSFIGFLRAEEYLVAVLGGKQPDLKRFVSAPLYVSFDTALATVFEEMGKRRCHLFFVRGEDKHTLGIVTMEDLLESIVGDINDSDDTSASEKGRAKA